MRFLTWFFNLKPTGHRNEYLVTRNGWIVIGRTPARSELRLVIRKGRKVFELHANPPAGYHEIRRRDGSGVWVSDDEKQ
jgi:hypothetical protein